VQFSPHDSGPVQVLHMILVLTSAHECVNRCAHVSVSGRLNTGWTLYEQQFVW
jgi:hypothetical protein